MMTNVCETSTRCSFGICGSNTSLTMIKLVSRFEKLNPSPTTNAKARILLKEKKATVKRLRPFTIQLTYETKTTYVQKSTLGIDSGYLNIGFSVVD